MSQVSFTLAAMSHTPILPANFDLYNPNPKPRRDESLVCNNCNEMFYPLDGEGFVPNEPRDNPYNYHFCEAACFLAFTRSSQDPPIYNAIANRVVLQEMRTVEPYGSSFELQCNGGTKTLEEYKGHPQRVTVTEGGEKRNKLDAANTYVALPPEPYEEMTEMRRMLAMLRGEPLDDGVSILQHDGDADEMET